MSDLHTSSSCCLYRPLVPTAAALVTGIGAGVSRPGYVWPVAGALLLFALILFRNILNQRPGLIPALFFVFLAGYLTVQPWLVATAPDGHVSHFVGSRRWRVCGRIAEEPMLAKGRWRFVLAAESIEAGGHRHPVSGRVMVSGRGGWPGAGRGDQVVFNGKLRAVRGFANPGGFNYERFQALRGIRTRSYAKNGSLLVIAARRTFPWMRRLDLCRTRLAGMMERALTGFSPSTLQLLEALLIGRSAQLSDRTRRQFNRAGVGHVLAISGLHVGMVAAAAFGSLQWLLAWIPWLLRRGWIGRAAALVSLIPVIGYGLLAGFSPSTQRAVLMVTVFLLGFWVGCRPDWFNTLAVAALVILAVQPPDLLSISFQLSFMAVGTILAGLRSWPRRMPDGEHHPLALPHIFRRLAAFAWVSVLATLGTLPLVLYYFNRVSLVGPAVNLVVVPLVGVVVVPMGLAGVAVAGLSVDLATLLWKVAALGVELMHTVVAWVARWPWASVQCITPSGLEIGLYYLCAVLLLCWKRVSRPKVFLALLLSLWLVDTGYWTYQRFGRRELRVTAVDVGQGTANLIEFPGGCVAMVDGGGFSDNAVFDVGRQILAPFLWRKKIRTVDLVVLSHANSDHLNGLLYLLDHFHVHEAWSNGQNARSACFDEWAKRLTAPGVTHLKVGQIPSGWMRHGVRLDVLAPVPDFLHRSAAEPWRDLNNNSLVLHLRYKHVSFLFSGDIMADAEAELVNRLGRQGLASTILLMPHHGSRSSGTHPFLQAVWPREALISAGWHNRFGFPHAEVTRRLTQSGIRTWCTAEDGAICIVSDGSSYRITSGRGKGPVYVRIQPESDNSDSAGRFYPDQAQRDDLRSNCR